MGLYPDFGSGCGMVMDLASFFDFVHVGVGPVPHGGDDIAQAVSEGGEGVFDLGGDGGIGVAVDEPISFQGSQGLGEHLLADPLDLGSKL